MPNENAADFFFYDVSFSQYRHSDRRGGSPYHYIAYMREGHGVIEGIDGKMELEPGDFFYIPKDYPYQSFWHNDGLVQFDSFGFKDFLLHPAQQYMMQKIDASPLAHQIKDALYGNKDLNYHTMGLFCMLLHDLISSMHSAPQNSKAALVQKAESFMARESHFLITDVARFCGISESGLYAAFRQERGYTPIAAKQKILAEKAMKLLLSTELTVDAISYQLGFHSTTYFRRIFKAHFGRCPSEVRREYGF